jgi:FkbM family methyltransferase
MKSQHKKRLRGAAKFALPYVAKVFRNRLAQKAMRFSELSFCLIQGKGSGSGWDISSEINVAASLVNTKTPVLLDVGANWGHWSTGMLKLFPQCSKLLIVEPQAKCVEALTRIEFPDKIIFPCAVADKAGELDFFTSEEAESWSPASLYERVETYFSDVKQRKLSVPVMKLDDILESSGILSVDFMKMDIEGAEFPALKGAEASFRHSKIKALSFEFGSGNINSRTFFRDFWDFLRRYNFSIFRILPGGDTLPINVYYEDLEYFRGVTNYVARI